MASALNAFSLRTTQRAIASSAARRHSLKLRPAAAATPHSPPPPSCQLASPQSRPAGPAASPSRWRTSTGNELDRGRGFSVRSAASDVAPPAAPKPAERADDASWQVKILYDGDCPLCMREVDFLRGRNEKFGTLKFVNISAEDYSAEENAGITFEQAMGHIHGIKRDGTVVTGVEAFRVFYEVIGLGWVYAATKLKPVQAAADALYEVWAKYRLPLTGRPALEAVIEERRRAKRGVKGCVEEDPCKVDY